MTKSKIKIAFFIPNLGGGGAERVVSTLLRHIDRERFQPLLVLFEKEGALLQDLPSWVDVYSLRSPRGKFWFGMQWFKRHNMVMQFAKVVRVLKPDAVLSFMWYPNAVAILAKILSRFNTKVLVSERTSTFVYGSRHANMLRNLVLRFLYPRADCVLTPTKAIADDIIHRGTYRRKVKVIHNPVDIPRIREQARDHNVHPWLSDAIPVIAASGRLGKEKGFARLIRGMALLKEQRVQCRLLILGEGTARASLEKLVTELDLLDRIALAGFQRNPYKYMVRAKVFVLSSLYEGFPNVLLEALALGVPAVATRCPTGPEEIIEHGKSGLLVAPADEHALAEAISSLLRDERLRLKLGAEGKKRAEDFSVDKIVRQYEDVIESVCAGSAAE
jgi:glycosyltransferase involved in cell wall biosynthesis